MAKNLAKTIPLEIRQKVASSAIKETLQDAGATIVQGHEVSLPTGGKKLRVVVRPSQKSAKQVSIDNVEKMAASSHLTFNQTSSVLTTFRKALGQSCIEANAMKKIVDKTHSEDSFFCLKTLNFQDKCGKPLLKTIPIVKDIETYLHHICTMRGLDPFDIQIKIGIDFGGESLKVGMSTLLNEDHQLSETGSNLNSVNHVLLLAMGIFSYLQKSFSFIFQSQKK